MIVRIVSRIEKLDLDCFKVSSIEKCFSHIRNKFQVLSSNLSLNSNWNSGTNGGKHRFYTPTSIYILFIY